MKLLAIETSTAVCSVGLKVDGMIISDCVNEVPQHAQCILPMIDALLKKADIQLNQLDAIAWGRGPGSFTGLRISASVVQGLAFSHDLPVIAVSTLQAIAQQVYRLQQITSIVSVIDARMQEVYWAHFQLESGWMKLVGEEHVSAREKISVTDVSQFQLLPDMIDILAIAENQLDSVNHFCVEAAIPIYIRDRVTT